MVAPKPTQAPVPDLSYLTEDELLEREFTTSDPESAANLSNDPPPENEVGEPESAYDMTARGQKVRCVFCKYPNHYRGIVVRYEPSGARRLVGRNCAEDHFGVDFKQKLIEFDAAADRQSYVRRRRAFLTARAKLIEEFRTLKSEPAVQMHDLLWRKWRDSFTDLSGELAEVVRRGEILAIDREVPDEAAERERKQRLGDRFESERQAAKAAGRRWRITKTIRENVGPVAGPLFFLPGISVSRRLDEILGTLQEKSRLLSRDDLKTSQIKAALVELGELRDQVVHEFDRLTDLQTAFSPANLTSVAKWANENAREAEKQFVKQFGGLPPTADRYRANGSSIVDTSGLDTKAELSFFRVPKRTLVDLFTEAISTEREPERRGQLSKSA